MSLPIPQGEPDVTDDLDVDTLDHMMSELREPAASSSGDGDPLYEAYMMHPALSSVDDDPYEMSVGDGGDPYEEWVGDGGI